MNHKNKLLLIVTLLLYVVNVSGQEKPNVILIMADDMGQECLGSYGSPYSTPVLDSLARTGIRFTNAISQPLCTPSRVKIMTGLRNYKNYSKFEYLDRNQRTIGHLMKDAGYATIIAGKWQLNGIVHNMPDALDNTTPNKFGFDEYSLWQLTKPRTSKSERYANPLIEKNGMLLEQDNEAYGPDLFTDHILDFMQRKKEEPFFVYFPMVLVHDPFVPTPNSKDWDVMDNRYTNDTTYFKDMVAYVDTVVGRIASTLRELELDNTIIIFTGDNGTHPSISTHTAHGVIKGDKGQPTDGGTKVPLIINWSHMQEKGRVTDGLVEFTDFYATLAELTSQKEHVDGKSFLNVINGAKDTKRKTVMVHYDPHWGNFDKAWFIRDKRYKLYEDKRFFDLENDRLEKNPLRLKELDKNEKRIYRKFQKQFKKTSLNK